jgi:uncharacterized YccA/Bax inhibitor family protein
MLSPSTTNPAFTGFGHMDDAIVELRGKPEGPLTVSGTVNKTGLLLALTVASAAATWAQLLAGGAAAFPAVMAATKVAGVVAMVAALASMFKPLWSSFTVRGPTGEGVVSKRGGGKPSRRARRVVAACRPP